MRIVHLIDYFQPDVGYQETFLALAQKKLGHDVTVVTSDRYHNFPDYDNSYRSLLGERVTGAREGIERGIRTIRLRSYEIPGTTLIFLAGLSQAIHKLSPDLVHCHGVYSFTSFFISRIKKETGFKLIYDTHAASFNTDFNKTFFRKLYHYLYKKFFAGYIKTKADSIFAIGQAERNFIADDLDLQRRQVPIIRLGVDTELFKFTAINRKKIRSKYDIDNNAFVFIFTGKITPNKDVHVLIEALEKFSKSNFVVFLIGNGPERYLQNMKKRALYTRIIHIPFIENRKLPGFFSASDIAVYPGDFTISILEAMSCNLPVVIAQWSGTNDLKKSGGIKTFSRYNAEALFNNLSSLVYNKNLVIDFGIRNRNFIRNNYSWKKLAIMSLKLI